MTDADSVANMIDWWREAGYDTAILEEPTNWLARPLPSSKQAPVPAETKPETVVLPATLDAFTAWLADGDDVAEARWGASRLLPAGDPAAGLMIMTDMPDPGDIEAGMLMAGDLGRLFDRMLAAIGRDRASIYLASMAMARPPAGRVDAASAPRLAEVGLHHAALVRPRTLILMGETVSRALLGMDLRDARGKKHSIHRDGISIDVIATFHPRFLMERPAAKAEAWKDLQLLFVGGDK